MLRQIFKIRLHIIVYAAMYVTGFGKMCKVHTSDFAHLDIYKNHMECYKNLKFSGLINKGIVFLQFLQVSHLLDICSRSYE